MPPKHTKSPFRLRSQAAGAARETERRPDKPATSGNDVPASPPQALASARHRGQTIPTLQLPPDPPGPQALDKEDSEKRLRPHLPRLPIRCLRAGGFLLLSATPSREQPSSSSHAALQPQCVTAAASPRSERPATRSRSGRATAGSRQPKRGTWDGTWTATTSIPRFKSVLIRSSSKFAAVRWSLWPLRSPQTSRMVAWGNVNSNQNVEPPKLLFGLGPPAGYFHYSLASLSPEPLLLILKLSRCNLSSPRILKNILDEKYRPHDLVHLLPQEHRVVLFKMIS
jgi:hypothetical protein